ncbi:MAG: acyltransferase, partial [Sphingobacteriales bacterium]|nr:acyltransferase [Sphingobacteriales bacterium]
MKYIKQLDSIRAFAVICVVICHWVPINNIIQRLTFWTLGSIGVDMFFVLSGFLITKILFDSANKAESGELTKLQVAKNFYIRRSLRIFPIYYLIIFFLLFFQKQTGMDVQSGLVYYLTYTSNFYFFHKGNWDGISHLWSLAVEEQFYLIWPWLILFINRKYYLHIILSFIAVSVAAQYFLADVKLSSVLTITCFDAFGLGALLAWVITFRVKELNRFYKGISIAACIAFIFFITGLIQQKWAYIPVRPLISIISLWVITYVVLNQETGKLKFKFFFNNSILIFLGKISYGIYLYHDIIPGTLNAKIINVYFNPLLPDILAKKYWGQLFLIENIILLIV